MIHILKATLLASFLAITFFSSAAAIAGGYEKGVMWSGKSAGVGNAVVSTSAGGESLFFNPAGLANTERGDITLNVSPTNIKIKGHIASSATEEETDKNYSTLGSAFASYKIMEKLGVGVGFYVAGGERATYESVDLTRDANVSFKPTIETDLKVLEYSIGAALEPFPGLRFGAAWRIAKAEGGFSTIKKTITNTAYSYINITDAKQTRYNGFRLGAQYQNPDNTWGIGAAYRSNIDFTAEGRSGGSVTVIPTNTTTAATGAKTYIETSLPLAISVGGNMLFGESFRLLGGIDYVKYSHVKQLGIIGTLNGTTLPNLPFNSKDMWNYRIGGEYTGLQSVALRMGYVFSSRVTSKTDTRATLSPAGHGHTIAAGAGTSFMDKKLALDGALEYAFNSGSGTASATPTGSTTKELLTGVDTKAKASVLALHAGVTYRF